MGKKARNKEFKKIPFPAWVTNLLENTVEKHRLTGFQLKEIGYVPPEGVVLFDTMMYDYNYPVIRDMNHERRVRRAFERNGWEGVNAYFESLLKALQPKLSDGQ